MPDHPHPELLVAFGAAVRRLRRERGWSQEEFADRVGVHRTYMGSVERGERNLSLLNIARMADALHVTLSALMAEVEGSSDGRSVSASM
ncbi:MAG: helix-turn-helix domain-containing protein [Candidatus Limnocylindrales bacterium]